MKPKIILGVRPHVQHLASIIIWLRIQIQAYGDPSGLPAKCDSSFGLLTIE